MNKFIAKILLPTWLSELNVLSESRSKLTWIATTDYFLGVTTLFVRSLVCVMVMSIVVGWWLWCEHTLFNQLKSISDILLFSLHRKLFVSLSAPSKPTHTWNSWFYFYVYLRMLVASFVGWFGYFWRNRQGGHARGLTIGVARMSAPSEIMKNCLFSLMLAEAIGTSIVFDKRKKWI